MIQQTLTHASCYKTLNPDPIFPEEPDKWTILYSSGGVATTEQVMFDGEDTYTLWQNLVTEKDINHEISVSQNDLVYSNGISYAKSSTAIIQPGCMAGNGLWFVILGQGAWEIQMAVCSARSFCGSGSCVFFLAFHIGHRPVVSQASGFKPAIGATSGGRLARRITNDAGPSVWRRLEQGSSDLRPKLFAA
jgi:hypothetical protein